MNSMQLKDKLRSISKEKSVDFNTLLRLYMYDRFLERLSKSKYRDNFVLKGGFYLSTLFGVENRTTMDIDTTVKVYYLKEIGNIIDKVHRTEDTNFNLNFGDLNEYNFILDNSNNVRVIDLDSSYTGDSNPINSAYYLLKNQYLSMVNNKYGATDNGIIIPTDNSDLYCYNMMILNAIAGRSMFKENIDVYYDYINYLKNMGIDENIIDAFNRIYVPVDNSNPKDYLDTIDEERAKLLRFDTFRKRR